MEGGLWRPLPGRHQAQEKAGSWEGPGRGTLTIMAAARGGRELWEVGKFWTLKKGEVLLDLTQLPLLHPDAPSPSPMQHRRMDHHPTPPPCLDPATVALRLDRESES